MVIPGDADSLDAFGRYREGWENPTPNPYRFGAAWGYLTDTLGSGLLQLGERYYSPLLGRFLQQDPARDGANWYAYVDNNPLVGVDPEGLRRGVFRWIGDQVRGALDLPGRAIDAIASGITNALMPSGLGDALAPDRTNPGLSGIYATVGRGEGFDAEEAAKQCLVVPMVSALSQPFADWLSQRGLPCRRELDEQVVDTPRGQSEWVTLSTRRMRALAASGITTSSTSMRRVRTGGSGWGPMAR